MIGKATEATTTGAQSALSDNGTTVTSTEPVHAPSLAATGSDPFVNLPTNPTHTCSDGDFFYYGSGAFDLCNSTTAATVLTVPTVYSVAGTALPTCNSTYYTSTQKNLTLPVSDLALNTLGAAYVGSGTTSGLVSCGHNYLGSYNWYIAAADTTSVLQMQDTFAGTNGTVLSLHSADTGQTWTHTFTSTWTNTITLNGSNKLVTASIGIYYSSLVPSSANYTVSAGFTASGTTNDSAGVFARMTSLSSTTLSGYVCGFFSGIGIKLQKYTGTDTATQLGTTDTGATSGTHTIAINANGSLLTCYIDGVASTLATATDTTFSAAGQVGLYIYNTSSGTYLINSPFNVQ